MFCFFLTLHVDILVFTKAVYNLGFQGQQFIHQGEYTLEGLLDFPNALLVVLLHAEKHLGPNGTTLRQIAQARH